MIKSDDSESIMLPMPTQEKVVEPGRYSKQKLVLGTHTSEGEQNYLMLAEARPHGLMRP